MINYNILITDGKITNSYLNLNKDEFLEKLWEWCYEDDLWDFINENPEVLTNSEDLENYILGTFIPEDLFHRYEDDDLNCFTFTASDEKLEVKEFDDYKILLPFIMDKITENYNKITEEYNKEDCDK